VREESKEKFAELVDEIIVKELGRSKLFEVVDEIGPGTLIVQASMLDIVSNVPPPAAGRVDIYLSAVGEATIAFQLIDAESGVIQATISERRRIQPPGTMNTVSTIPTNQATVWADVARWARKAAVDLRRELEKTAKKSDK
jgi:hypothetical protein